MLAPLSSKMKRCCGSPPPHSPRRTAGSKSKKLPRQTKPLTSFAIRCGQGMRGLCLINRTGIKKNQLRCRNINLFYLCAFGDQKFGEDLRKCETYYDLVEAWKYPMHVSLLQNPEIRRPHSFTRFFLYSLIFCPVMIIRLNVHPTPRYLCPRFRRLL